MSYREIHELFVVCDECHTSLSIYDATYEDADNEAADHGWQCDELQGRHYCPLHWHLECHDCDITDSGAPDELEAAGWHIDRDYPCDSLCPNHRHLECRECCKWDVGPLHRLEYEGWQVNADDFKKSLCPECVKKQEGNEMKVKKTLIDMIVKWHQDGYSLDEIAPLVPQVPKEEIKAIIQHTRE